MACFSFVRNKREEVDGLDISLGVVLPAGQSEAVLHSAVHSYGQQLKALVKSLKKAHVIPEDFPLSVLKFLKDATIRPS